jgi:hypothetical protein
MITREIPVTAEWLVTLFNSLTPEERGTTAATGDRPSLVLHQLCLREDARHAGDAEDHMLVFVADVSKEEFGRMLGRK